MTKRTKALAVAALALLPLAAACKEPPPQEKPYLCNALIFQPVDRPTVGNWRPWDTTGHTVGEWWFVCHTTVVLFKADLAGNTQPNGLLNITVSLEPPPVTGGDPRYLAMGFSDLRDPNVWRQAAFKPW